MEILGRLKFFVGEVGYGKSWYVCEIYIYIYRGNVVGNIEWRERESEGDGSVSRSIFSYICVLGVQEKMFCEVFGWLVR